LHRGTLFVHTLCTHCLYTLFVHPSSSLSSLKLKDFVLQTVQIFRVFKNDLFFFFFFFCVSKRLCILLDYTNMLMLVALCLICSVYVLYMLCICCVYVVYMLCICCVYVLYMFCICSVYVVYMFCICCVYVLYMLCICSVYVVSNLADFFLLLIQCHQFAVHVTCRQFTVLRFS
jgi:hypothetical protein